MALGVEGQASSQALDMFTNSFLTTKYHWLNVCFKRCGDVHSTYDRGLAPNPTKLVPRRNAGLCTKLENLGKVGRSPFGRQVTRRIQTALDLGPGEKTKINLADLHQVVLDMKLPVDLVHA